MKLKLRNKNKYRVIFLKPLGTNNYKKFDEKSFNPKDESISFEDKTFPLTGECYTYINGKTTYIFADYEKEQIIKFNKNSIGIDAKFLDKFLTTGKTGIVGQLMSIMKSDMKTETNWLQNMKPIVIFILGAVIGFLSHGSL